MGILDQLSGAQKWQPPQPDPVTGQVPPDPVGTALLHFPSLLGQKATGLYNTLVGTPLNLIQNGGTRDQFADAGAGLAGLISSGGVGNTEADALGMGFRAYHGSPHSGVTAFDAAKLGTGEGNLWQGRGTYLSDDPAVADLYRKTPQSAGSGSRYTVDVQPEASDFADYKTALGDQPAHVRAAIDGYLDQIDPRGTKYMRTGDESVPGLPFDLEGLHETLMASGKAAGLTDALKNAGVPGIRYPDPGVGAKATNYVVFDPAHAQITHENDLPVKPSAVAPPDFWSNWVAKGNT